MTNQSSSNPNALVNFKPLIVIFITIIISSFALYVAHEQNSLMDIMRYFMGLFFIIFSMFKGFDLDGFAKGFQKYDLIAKKSRNYAYIYPFIELSLGLAYLANFQPLLTNMITLVIMLISSIGVIGSIKSGMNLKCACLGTTLNVPLSTVTVIENVGMSIMAAVAVLIC